jgi:hypothetical protein
MAITDQRPARLFLGPLFMIPITWVQDALAKK